MRKFVSAVLALCMVMSFTVCAFAAPAKTDYQIVNPYASVNWETWGQYKADLHCHSLVSDGSNDFDDMIEKHYELNYDILAMTDHATVDRGWTVANTTPYMSLAGKIKQEDLTIKVTPLTQERYEQITSGSDRNGRGMTRVPFGIEHNAASLNNTHVNSFFVDTGNGYMGGTSDYDVVLKSVEKKGGVSVINHPGEYTGMKKESNPELAYEGDAEYYVNKFSHLLLEYKSCIGIDINSKDDGRTKNDRKLWDKLLQNCIPNGRSVLAVATSDAHAFHVVDAGWTMLAMPANTPENIRTCLETGAFFAASRSIKNSKELAILGAETGEDYGTEWRADDAAARPAVTNVAINEQENTIELTVENEKTVHWIANGEVIATGTKISLNEHEDKIGSYVRAEVFGSGGILYTQAFVLKYDGSPEAKDFSGFFDWGNVVTGIFDTIVLVFNVVPLFPLFWKLLTGRFFQLPFFNAFS